MLEAVIFDFDGVLIDTPSYYFKHMRSYLGKLHPKVEDKDISDLVGYSFSDKLIFINNKYGLNVQKEEFVKQTEDAMKLEMSSMLSLDPALGALLAELRENNIKLAVASNNSRKNIDYFLSLIGIMDYFSTIVSYGDAKNPKPFPDVYLQALKRMRKKPGNCIAIEDTSVGLEAAKKAGLKCIAIPHKLTSYHDFAGAELVVNGFSDLSFAKLKGLVG